ncbi:aldehyde dehydrogenase family protein [Actinoplanes sp. CA-131856]
MQVTPRIGGRPATSAEWIEVLSPYDSKPVARVPSLGPPHVAAAVAAAAAALHRDDFPGPRRAEVLERAAALLTDRVEEFAVTLSREAAHPIRDARAETIHAATTFRHAAAESRSPSATAPPGDDFSPSPHSTADFRPSSVSTADFPPSSGSTADFPPSPHSTADLPPSSGSAADLPPSSRSTADFPLGFTLRRPAGVLAVISSPRFPLVAHVLGPAVAAGCPVVLKPSDATPLSAIRLVELLIEAGLPSDWISVLTGPDTAAPLAAHPVPAILSFAGTPTGLRHLTERRRPPEADAAIRYPADAPARRRPEADADAATRYPTEAPGRRPSEAGYPAGAPARRPTEVEGRVDNAGPAAIGRRLLAEFDAPVPVIVARDADVDRATAALRGDISLFVDQALHDQLAERLRAALARLRPGDPRDEATDAVPVVEVKPFAGLTEAIRLANESGGGAQAAIFTSDLGSAMRAARELRFARVLVNEVPRFALPLGVRELTDLKTVVVAA